jgi:hypothetical protein
MVSSGLKAAATWHRKTILNNCRECCGGMGFMAANRIGPMLNDMDGGLAAAGRCRVVLRGLFLLLLRDAALVLHCRVLPCLVVELNAHCGPAAVDTTFEGDNTVLMQQARLDPGQLHACMS